MKPQIVIYCCANSSVVSEEDIEKIIPENQAEIRISRLPCSGRTDALYLLRAVETGATLVMIVGCLKGQCQFLEGNLRAGMRVRYANRLLAEAGLGEDRIRMVHIAAGDETSFAPALRDAVASARKIGPWMATAD
jgi:coenzyme F420-reducing hydrogenase delta subunit